MIRFSEFSKALMGWYKKNARTLPWRKTRDPYRIWISEIMLQQTTVKAVIPYYLRWTKDYPTIKHAARAPLRKILKSWQGLGYYSRAKNLHKAAKIICREFGSRLPNSRHELQKLPGFGPYTLGAVLSMAFGQRHAVIDANVRRVVMRLLALRGKADTRHDTVIHSFLEKVMPSKGTGMFNQALMDLGAMICRSNEPFCLTCPVKGFCKAYEKGLQEIIPEKNRLKLTNISAVIAVIENKHRYFIQKRPSTGLFADLWEFPGGKIEKGEGIKSALAREIREELGVGLSWCRTFMTTQQAYTRFRVKLHIWKCGCKIMPPEDRTHRWVSLKDLVTYPMPSGSAKIVESLKCKV